MKRLANLPENQSMNDILLARKLREAVKKRFDLTEEIKLSLDLKRRLLEDLNAYLDSKDNDLGEKAVKVMREKYETDRADYLNELERLRLLRQLERLSIGRKLNQRQLHDCEDAS